MCTPGMAQPLRAVIYSRISHDDAGIGLGVERQETDCLRLISSHGWVLSHPPYRENDTPASTLSRKPRPVYEQMLDDAAAGEIDALVAYSTSRLTRRPLDFERLLTLSEDMDVRIETVTAGFLDLATADGRALGRLLSAMDAAESERKGELIRRALRQRRQAGLWWGQPPFGYVRDSAPGGLVVDPVGAAMVAEAAVRVLEGESMTGICRHWNEMGRRTSTGRAWYASRLLSMLRSPAAAGLIQVDGGLVPGSWPPIVERATWDALQTLFREPGRYRQRVSRQEPHPLAGLLRCARCASSLRRNLTADHDVFWCSATAPGSCGIKTQIPTQPLERFLFERIAGSDHPTRSVPTLNTEMLQGQLDELRERRTELQDDYYADLRDRDRFVGRITSLAARIRHLDVDLARDARLRNQLHRREAPSLTAPDLDRARWLRESVAFVEVHGHPAGTCRPPSSWTQRAEQISQRVVIQWLRQQRRSPAPASSEH